MGCIGPATVARREREESVSWSGRRETVPGLARNEDERWGIGEVENIEECLNTGRKVKQSASEREKTEREGGELDASRLKED